MMQNMQIVHEFLKILARKLFLKWKRLESSDFLIHHRYGNFSTTFISIVRITFVLQDMYSNNYRN